MNSKRSAFVRGLEIGGNAPVRIQTMYDDVIKGIDPETVVDRIYSLSSQGCDIIRFSYVSSLDRDNFTYIVKHSPIPVVADIHFDYKIALRVADLGVDCLRINPGNIGSEAKIREVVAAAKHNDISMRIGVNAGSLEKDLQKKYGEPTGEALLESALRHIDILDRLNFHEFKISVKASNVFLTMDAYRLLSKQIDNPLHLGVTEAGIYRTGTVKSAIALGGLLMEGIGDTMRISLAAEPEDEVKIGFDILKSLGLRSNGINFIACPSCSRQEFNVIKVMQSLEERLEDIRTPMDVSVIGCKVNGPGEAKEADIGVVGASPRSLVYRNGEKSHLIDTNQLVDEIETMVRQRVKELEEAKSKEIIRTSFPE